MQSERFQAMYGYVLRKGTSGEGSRGGRVIGHTPSGKPIYASEGRAGGSSERKPYPGEEAHKLPPNEPQKKKTYLPPDGTAPHYSDTPSLRAYKQILSAFKRAGIDFMGHITYDPKTDHIKTISPQAADLLRRVTASTQAAKQQLQKPKAG
jgi:hypothetical protein